MRRFVSLVVLLLLLAPASLAAAAPPDTATPGRHDIDRLSCRGRAESAS